MPGSTGLPARGSSCRVPAPPSLVAFAVRLARSTRPTDDDAPSIIKRYVNWGAGPRAGIYIRKAAQAMAAFENRPSAGVEHVKKVAVPVLRHRLILTPDASLRDETIDNDVQLKRALDLLKSWDVFKQVVQKKAA